MDEPLKRINKYLSEVGYCSRREADKLIEAGRVTVNGNIPEKGTKLSSDDKVYVDGTLVKNTKNKFTYLAFNKPVGIVCTTDTRIEKDNIIDYINYHKRIFPIGRLDKPSEGLILLTDDGDIVNKILRASNNHEKEYIVTVDKPISQTFVERMSKGIYLEELKQTTKPCIVKKLNSNKFKIILTQGLNRQIRRMCSHLNYEVLTLKRIRIMNIKLDLSVGKYRELSKEEYKELSKLISDSTKEFKPKTVKRK
ncbi:pseudouridine synthase [Seonamhaeicola sediminis]|uniref:Pseudouridine synthase n=1 Tax=Seonamhaeicola sediminis TaxID=2528206 RepID=A0A562YD55_9FLAO|nr:pseudouridine synthase [Seonamhaeicola sediminis]TWO32520.1 pseudouridine synthase [Seonamhaeicola sediminis]